MTTDSTSFKPRNRENSHIPKNRSSRPFWIKTLADFSESGLSVQKFCRLKNLAPSNFYNWRKRLRDEKGDESPAPVTFVPLEVRTADNSPVSLKKDIQNQQAPFSPAMEKSKNDAGLSLHFNNGLKISVEMDFHGATLQRLMHLLSSQGLEAC